jgi:hypothetical protein
MYFVMIWMRERERNTATREEWEMEVFNFIFVSEF